MPPFVVLEHDHPELHWDFMLEHGGVLMTWRLEAFPHPAATGQKFKAVASADHRLLYLNYEGPVSGHRGQVIRRDQGAYDLLADEASAGDPDERWRTGPLLLCLAGQHLCGKFSLQRLERDVWSLEFLESVATLP